MAAARELVIDRRVTRAAIGGSDAGVDDEAIVVRAGLAVDHLMAVEAGDAFLSVLAHLVFVDDGILVVAVTLGALAAGLHVIRRRLLRDDGRALGVDDVSRHDQGRAKNQGDEDGAEVHEFVLVQIFWRVQSFNHWNAR